MSKLTIAFSSFSLGVLSSFLLLSGTHASMRAQEPPPSPPSQAAPLEPLLVGGAGVPTVPPITQHFEDFGIVGMSGAFGVDGTECVRCKFGGPVLRYGGGNFQFTDFSMTGPVQVEFTGAARNTLLFIDFVQRLAAGQAPQQPTMPSAPIIKTAAVKNQIMGSFGTPR